MDEQRNTIMTEQLHSILHKEMKIFCESVGGEMQKDEQEEIYSSSGSTSRFTSFHK